jgi:hypothetical protein
MAVDVIIKKRRTAVDVTKILMTLKLKYPIILTEKHVCEVKLAQGQKIISVFLWMLTMNP